MKIFLEIDGMLTEVVTVMTAAYHFKYHRRTIQRQCEEGKLIAFYVDGRWLIDARELKPVAKALDCPGQFQAS